MIFIRLIIACRNNQLIWKINKRQTQFNVKIVGIFVDFTDRGINVCRQPLDDGADLPQVREQLREHVRDAPLTDDGRLPPLLKLGADLSQIALYNYNKQKGKVSKFMKESKFFSLLDGGRNSSLNCIL